MNIKHLTLASLLLSSSIIASDTINDSIKNGTITGDVTLYAEKADKKGNNPDEGFTSGSIGLGYETADFNGFKASIGFRGNHDFSEVEDGDYGETDKSILHTANISYANDMANLTIGRQEVDLEWMGDFHEAAILGITAIADTNITLGYTKRIAVADADAALESFDKINDDNGAYVLDVKYEGIKNLLLNPYYYKAQDVANWYGLKADYDINTFGATGHIAASKEDIAGKDDGQIMQLEARTNLVGLGLNIGYIKTDKDIGVESMAIVGDNINPFEDSEKVYVADAKTTYIGLSYELAGVELASIYGQTKYGQDKEKELNIAADYSITDNLSTGLLFVDVDAQDSDDDYNKITATLAYSF
tara:strand:- start:122 stop:1201 length:1080 start_codon:yes stop_codon:yes gene_type:complete